MVSDGQPGLTGVIWEVCAHWPQAQAQMKDLETRRGVFPSFRPQDPSHHKRLLSTIELVEVSSCGLAVRPSPQDTFWDLVSERGLGGLGLWERPVIVLIWQLPHLNVTLTRSREPGELTHLV